MSIRKQYEYTDKYQKANIRRITVKLNRKTDQKLIEKIDSVDNVQGYIKSLIEADIEKEKKVGRLTKPYFNTY